MKEAIAIINQKGGVGKSTTALALGAGLSLKGHKVLLIDLDAQGNLTYTLGANDTGLTVLEVLTGTATAKQATQHTSQGAVIPASPALAGADTLLTAVGKEYKLKEATAPLKRLYDYIIIDTPPALGILTINALTACTWAIVTAQADAYSLKGIAQLHNTIGAVKEYCNSSLKVKGILLTRHNPRTVLSRDIADVIQRTARGLNTKLFKVTIREAVAVREAQARQQDLFSYAPKGTATEDYTAFIKELLKED